MLATCSAFSRLSVISRPSHQKLSFKSNVAGANLVVPQRTSVVPSAVAFVIEAKQNSLRRQRTAEKSRVANKARRSEVRTLMKKVFTALEPFKAAPPSSEADLSPIQLLINEAYRVIDQAVSKGVLHKNTAARRKARMALARQSILIEAGLYTPQ